jgi:hypothetical protein
VLKGEGWMQEEWPLTSDLRDWLYADIPVKKDKKKNNNKN